MTDISTHAISRERLDGLSSYSLSTLSDLRLIQNRTSQFSIIGKTNVLEHNIARRDSEDAITYGRSHMRDNVVALKAYLAVTMLD
jgi:hypothetical protein